jgi:hypothetical protein
MTEPSTPLHYTANGNFVNGQYAPGADGFNMADISSASQSARLSRHDGRRDSRVQGGRHAVHRQLPGLWLLPRRRTEPERDDGGQFQGGVRLDPRQ